LAIEISKKELQQQAKWNIITPKNSSHLADVVLANVQIKGR
jgi:hypothetical protein